MKPIQIFVLLCTAALLFLAACESPETQSTDAESMQQAVPESITTQTLSESNWVLVNLHGEEFTLTMEGARQPGITFDGAEERVYGFAGCNQFTGGFTLEEAGRLSFTQMASTKMFCPDMEVEDRYMEALEQTTHAVMIEGMLQFSDRESAVVAVFYADPETPDF